MDLPVMLPEQLGAYLRAIRLGQGLTQTQLAQRLGLSQSRIVAIEKDPGRIRVQQLLQLLHVLQTRLVLQDPRPAGPARTPAALPDVLQVREAVPAPPGAADGVADGAPAPALPFPANQGEW